MAVSNQNIVRVGTRDAFDKSHTYCLMHIDSLQAAMCNLKGETLKLWLYCNKNQDGYQFELSQKALQEWGLKKDAYQTAKKKLMELGYLVPASEDSNVLIFYETLSEKPTNPTESVFQIQSEKPTMTGEEIGQKQRLVNLKNRQNAQAKCLKNRQCCLDFRQVSLKKHREIIQQYMIVH